MTENLDHGPGLAVGADRAPRNATTGDGRYAPLLMQLNPFLVFDMVLRNVVPGYREQVRGIGSLGLRRSAAPEPELFTRSQAAERAGLSTEDMGRLWRALGFAELDGDEPGYTSADIDAAREVADLAAEGVVDVDQVISMVRPMGHLVSRLGAAQVSALSGVKAVPPDHLSAQPRTVPSGRPRAPAGGVAPAGGEATGADRLVPLLEGLVVHAWRRHLVTAASAALPVRRMDDAGDPRAVGFIDITSYTTLSRRIPWAELSTLLDRFEACVFDCVAARGGQVIKTLGDEVLFVAPTAAAAADIALSVVDAAHEDPSLPSVHAGLAYGPLLERAGDVFGPTVNVASRVTDLSHGGTVLIDTSFHQMIDDDKRFRTQRRPRRPVRGYSSLATYRLRRAGPGSKHDAHGHD